MQLKPTTEAEATSVLPSSNGKTVRSRRAIVPFTHLAREGRMTVTIGRRELLAALGRHGGVVAARGTRAATGDADKVASRLRDRLGSCFWRHKTQIRSTIATFYSVQRSEIRSSSYGKSRSMDVTASMTPTTSISTACRRRSGMNAVSALTLLPVFQSLPGASFIVNGATLPKNSALTSAGAELRVANGVTLLAKFDGEFASHSSTYAGTGTLRYRW